MNVFSLLWPIFLPLSSLSHSSYSPYQALFFQLELRQETGNKEKLSDKIWHQGQT